MTEKWEYCEIDCDGAITRAWFYGEAGDYIYNPTQHARLGILLANYAMMDGKLYQLGGVVIGK